MFVYVLNLNEEIILMNFHYFNLIFHLMFKLLKPLEIKVLKFSFLIHYFYFINMTIFIIYHLLLNVNIYFIQLFIIYMVTINKTNIIIM